MSRSGQRRCSFSSGGNEGEPSVIFAVVGKSRQDLLRGSGADLSPLIRRVHFFFSVDTTSRLLGHNRWLGAVTSGHVKGCIYPVCVTDLLLSRVWGLLRCICCLCQPSTSSSPARGRLQNATESRQPSSERLHIGMHAPMNHSCTSNSCVIQT